MNKQELKSLANEVKEAVDAKGSHVHVGTWQGRPGVSINILWTSSSTGSRIAIHKWDDEATCKVRAIEGDAWRKPDSFEEYWAVDGVTFTADALAEVIGDGAA